MDPKTQKLRPSGRYLLLVTLLVLALYVLVPQLGDFKSSLHLLGHPDLPFVVAAAVLIALTYPAAAATYCLLAFRPLSYSRSVLVQLAIMFINRLLPGGSIVALGANYAYLRHSRHSGSQAASMVAANSLLGAAGHWLLVAATLALYPGKAAIMSGHSWPAGFAVKALAAMGLLTVVFALIYGRHKFARKVADLYGQLISYRHRPWHLAAGLLTSMLLTLCNVLSLLCCALALGIHLPFAAILIIFSFGISAGTATPTPGGLGGFEAGLVGGFIAYHVAGPQALAAALLFRLVSYWLPLPAGGLAFLASQKKQLFLAK